MFQFRTRFIFSLTLCLVTFVEPKEYILNKFRPYVNGGNGQQLIFYDTQQQQTQQRPQRGQRATEWNYDNFQAWGNVNPICTNGRRQSPIALGVKSSIISPLPPIKFQNYFKPLNTPLVIENNGKSASLDIPPMANPPTISGAKLPGRFEAINIHFHWGTPTSPGSEHTIKGFQYDVEMHIVHRNIKYPTTEEALQRNDGLAVLGIMLQVSDFRVKSNPAVNKILHPVPQISEYQSEATITGRLVLGDLLRDINVKKYYTYKGSLTTPPCSEVVTWIVFPDPIKVSAEKIQPLYDMIASDGTPLLDNWRPVQPRFNRLVKYKGGISGILPLFF